MNAGLGQGNIPPELVDGVLHAPVEVARDSVYAVRQRLWSVIATGNHQRNARLIDQDGIGLIDDRCGKVTVYLLPRIKRKLVTQIVKPYLIGSGISYVTGISLLPRRCFHVALDVTHSQSEPLVDLSHPLRITAGQVIIHREHMRAACSLCIPRDRGNSGQGLAFAGLHLGNLALGERQRTLKLDLEHLQLQHP